MIEIACPFCSYPVEIDLVLPIRQCPHCKQRIKLVRKPPKVPPVKPDYPFPVGIVPPNKSEIRYLATAVVLLTCGIILCVGFLMLRNFMMRGRLL